MLDYKGSHYHLNRLAYLLTLAIAAVVLLTTPSFAGPNAKFDISTKAISASGNPSITFMQLRVVDPSGQVIFDLHTDGSPITWTLPEEAADGFYSYEVTLGKEPKKEKRDKNNTHGIGPKTKAMTESGSILVKNGSIILPTEEETSMLDRIISIGSYAMNSIMDFIVAPAAADQVILDDLIVDGSVCAGQDCANGESFGFDTIRLKENNLRIRFVDTSSTSSFPARDWQITVNDSANGGLNKFSIDDIDGGKTPFTIEAGAPSHSLYVDDGGRIGLGTSTPVVDLHIKTGNTPTARLEQDGSSGFTPQTWDVAGNEANFFVRDATNGSTLPFKIKPGAPSDSLYVNSNGNIGMGTTNPQAALHITDSTASDLLIVGTDDSNNMFTVANTGDALLLGNLELGSSRSLKDNIYALNSAEAQHALENLAPVHFNYRSSPDVNSLGFIAEDVPNLVASNNRKSLKPMDIIAVLTKVTQEQQKSIEELKTTITQLQNKVDNGSNTPAAITLH